MSFKISSTSMSDPPDIESISIAGMYGGLNLRSEPEDVQSTQSPDMVNMWYRDGLLRKRWGQKLLAESGTTHDRTVQFYDRLFNGYLVWVDETVIKYAKPSRPDIAFVVKGIVLPLNTPKGCFVPFEEWLFYKAEGVYVRIKMEKGVPVGDWIVNGDSVNEDIVYTPTIAINRNPDGSGGDSYQPENRINPRKEVWFDVDDSSLEYYLPVHDCTVEGIQLDNCKVEKATDDEGNTVWRHYANVSDTDVYTDSDYHDASGKVIEPIVGGVTFSVTHTTDEQTVTDHLSVDVPIYIDETGWSSADHRTSANISSGTYLRNAAYSNMAVYPTLSAGHYTGNAGINDTTMLYGKLLKGVSTGKRSKYRTKLLKTALSKVPDYYDGLAYCVLDNGENMNVIVFQVDAADIDTMDSAESGIINRAVNKGTDDNISLCLSFQDYYIVSYEYAEDDWTVVSYLDKSGPLGHYAENCVYANFNLTHELTSKTIWVFWSSDCTASRTDIYDDDGTTKVKPYIVESAPNRIKKQVGNLALCEYSFKSIADHFLSVDCPSLSGHTLWWISVSGSDITFAYAIDDCFHAVTSVSETSSDGIWFGACGIVTETVHCADILDDDAERVHLYISESSDVFAINEIVCNYYALVYDTYYPASSYQIDDKTYQITGNPVVSVYSDTPESAYATYRNAAKYFAKQICSDGVSDNFVMLKSSDGTYIGYIIPEEDDGFRLISYNLSTTEYAAVGFIRVTLDTSQLTTSDITLTTPAVLSNRLRVTYRKVNKEALKAISDCKYAIDFGGSDAVCIAMANCEAQPNALFWSGNGSAGVDPTYFPMDQYNLCGTYQDPVNALAKYASYLIVLQGHQVSKGTYSIETNSDTSRNFIDIALATINPNRGCDMPWSVQMAQNYLCWMDSRYGCLYLSDTSEANENSVLCISENVNGSRFRHGLMYALQNADAETICSFDDGFRIYWFIEDELWVWDYSIASVSSDGVYALSWTRHTGFNVWSATSADTHRIFMLAPSGNMIEMADEFDDDLGEKIACHYTSPTQTMGGFYTRKNVRKLIVECSSENGGRFRIAIGSERSSNPGKERDVELKESMWLYEKQREFTDHFVIKPRLLHVNHFYFRVESDGDDGGLAISNAIITYTSGGVNK